MPILRDLALAIRTGEPVHQGNLTMIPLYGPALLEPDYLTLGESLETGLVSITEASEAGSVPQLRAENRGPRPVLLVDGEELVGAKQNRILNLSILLPGHRVTDIPVSCVEQGRWGYRSRHFSDSDNPLYPSARRQKVADVSLSIQHGDRVANQSALWSDIERKRRRHGTASETGAMGDIYQSQHARIRDYLQAFSARPEQTGAAFGLNGRVRGIELFDSPRTLATYLPKLVRSWGLDALEQERGRDEPVPAWEVSTALARLAEVEVRRFDSIGLGEDLRFGGAKEPGAALVYEGRVVHLVAFV
ncbi:MAG: DUF6569 family protein [Gemmatimonadota bacterium]